jgi:hypothetical protein
MARALLSAFPARAADIQGEIIDAHHHPGCRVHCGPARWRRRKRRSAQGRRQCRLAELHGRRRCGLRVRVDQGPDLHVLAAGRHGRTLYRHGQEYGVDIGFTKEARIIWLVLAPGAVAPGALAGEYVGGTGSVAVGSGVGANVLIGGGDKQVTLQPVSIEGVAGLNIAAGVVGIELKKTP